MESLRMGVTSLILILANVGILLGLPEHQAQIQGTVAEILSSRSLTNAHVGIYARNMTTGQVVLALNEHKLFVPASVMKLISTLAAWEVLGPGFQFETKVYIPKGSQPPIVGGDLIVRGSGDPSITVETLDRIAATLKERGFTTITGSVHIDNSAFGKAKWSFRWSWDLSDNPLVDAFVVQPFVTGFHPFAENDAAFYFGRLLKGSLKKQGIEVQGDVKVGRSNVATFEELTTLVSLPLVELVRVTNKASHNSYAEQILRAAAARRFGLGSLENSLKLLTAFLEKIVGADYSFRVADASGLSTYNLISPFTVVKVLEYAYERYGGLLGFISTLSRSGVDGTLAGRLRGLEIYGKTGTLAHVASLAGVAVTSSGAHLAFCIFVNNFTGEAPRAEIDRIVTWLCNNH